MGNFSRLFSKQIPKFITDEYPQFVLFIEKFFQFMEENTFIDKNIYNLSRTYKDVDVFLEAIKKEVAYNLPRPVVDESELLTKIKQLYVSKGSEDSLRFIFKIFFNKDIEIFVPSSQIFTASEGDWNQDYSIFVRTIIGDPFITEGKTVNVVTRSYNVNLDVIRVNQTIGESTSGVGSLDLGYVTELVENLIDLGLIEEDVTGSLTLPDLDSGYSGDYHELVINRNYSGNYRVGDIVQFSEDGKAFVGYIVPTITRVEVLRGGTGFKLGQTVDIDDDIENDGEVVLSGRGCRLKISKIGEGGSIAAAQLIRFGVEYPRSFFITLASNPLRIVSKTLFENNSIKADFEDRIVKYENTGYIVSNFEYAAEVGCVINYIITNPGSNYTNATATVETSPGVTAELTPIIGTDGKILEFILQNRGKGYTQDYPEITINGDGTGATAVAITGTLNYTVLEYFGESRGSFTSLIKYPFDPVENTAIIKLVSGPVAKYPGYYVDNRSFLSDSIALIDSHYYQNFSYVIRTDIPYDDYVGVVTSITHPAGYKMFGEYILKNDMDIKVDMTDMSNFTYNVIFNDYISAVDSPIDFFVPLFPDFIEFSDDFAIVDVACLFDNPYSVPVGVDGYFGENYNIGNTCVPSDDLDHIVNSGYLLNAATDFYQYDETLQPVANSDPWQYGYINNVDNLPSGSFTLYNSNFSSDGLVNGWRDAVAYDYPYPVVVKNESESAYGTVQPDEVALNASERTAWTVIRCIIPETGTHKLVARILGTALDTYDVRVILRINNVTEFSIVNPVGLTPVVPIGYEQEFNSGDSIDLCLTGFDTNLNHGYVPVEFSVEKINTL